MRSRGEFLQLGFSDGLVDETVLAVEPRHRILGFPLGGEAAVLMLEGRLDVVVINRLEMLNLTLAAHDERERRGLDPADGQHQALMSGTARGERIGTRKIHADKPVRPSTSQGRLLEIEEILVVPQAGIGLLDALFIQGIQEDAPYRLLIAEIVEDFVNEQLALAVRVAAVDDFISLRDKSFTMPNCFSQSLST